MADEEILQALAGAALDHAGDPQTLAVIADMARRPQDLEDEQPDEDTGPVNEEARQSVKDWIRGRVTAGIRGHVTESAEDDAPDLTPAEAHAAAAEFLRDLQAMLAEELGDDVIAQQESVEIRTYSELVHLMEAGFTGSIQTKSGQTWYYQDGRRVANPNKVAPQPKQPRAAAPAAPKAPRAPTAAQGVKKAAAAASAAQKLKARQDKAQAKQKAAADAAAAKQAAAQQKEAVKTAAFAAAKEIASNPGKAATPEQLGHLGQAVLTLTLKDLQALKKTLGAAGNAGTKAGAVKAIKDRAQRAAPTPAKPAAAAAPTAFKLAEHHATAVDAVKALAQKSGGLADIADVRDTLAAKGVKDRAQQDVVILDLHKKRILTASPYEGRQGITPRQQQAQLSFPGEAADRPHIGNLAIKEPGTTFDPANPAHEHRALTAAADAMRDLERQHTMTSELPKVPALVDAMKKAVPGLTTEHAHQLLQKWQKDDLLTLGVANDPHFEPRSGEGIKSSRGVLFYPEFHGPQLAARLRAGGK